jgi:hypothetical protein
MIVLALAAEWVRGGANARGLFDETSILGLFTNGSVPSTTPRIWLTSTPDNTASTGSWGMVNFFLSHTYTFSFLSHLLGTYFSMCFSLV